MNSASFVLKSSALCLLSSGLWLGALAQTLYVPNGTGGIGSSASGNSNVGIGTNAPRTSLEVRGAILAGDGTDATLGSLGFGVTYFGPNIVNTFGSMYSSAATTLGYGVKPKSGINGFVSSAGNSNFTKGALQITDELIFSNAAAATVPIGNDVVLTERLRINSAGNVGIGTPSPRSRLDLGSSLGAGNGTRIGDYLEINEREVINNALTMGWNAHIAADDGTFAPTYAPGTGMVLTMATGGISDLDFYGRNWAGDGTPKNLSAFTHVMRLSTNGNVGIGTTNPRYKVEVSAGDTRNVYLDTSNYPKIGTTYGSGSSIELYNGSTGAMIFTTGAPSYPFVFASGNVGIGTSAPTHKLAVNGTIRAKEVIVDTGWADYVFTDDYRLAPLSEIESHIKAEKHLPGIPSAAEVAAGGVSLGDMQVKMLAKIEELTLHQIQQEKQMKRMDAENRALREELEALKQATLK